MQRTSDPTAAMKRLALALLLLAALVYALAHALIERHAAWGYVAAFAEAAMIGAIADWFAVVALFRHPLGLPIPHTAIIPANKSRIGRNLADFLLTHFLSTDQVLLRLRAFDPALRLAQFLADPARSESVGRHFAAAARHGLEALDDARVRDFVRATVVERLGGVDLSGFAGQVLDVLTAERRHQAVLDAALRQVAALLEEEGTQAQIATVVADEMKLLKVVGLDVVAGRMAARKMVAGTGRLLAEMGEDPAHPLRLRFDDYMAGFVEDLKHDPALRTRVDELKAEVLAHPELHAYVSGLWTEVLGWLRDDLQREDSAVRARVAGVARGLGRQLLADEGMRQWINDQVLGSAPRWIERYREDIRRHIVARVDAWDTRELTDELERNIGRDLQFVRLNGTLVGGLIGLLIYSLTRWVG